MTLSSVLALAAAVAPSPSPTGAISSEAAPNLGSTYLLFILIAVAIGTWWAIRARTTRSPHGPGGQD